MPPPSSPPPDVEDRLVDHVHVGVLAEKNEWLVLELVYLLFETGGDRFCNEAQTDKHTHTNTRTKPTGNAHSFYYYIEIIIELYNNNVFVPSYRTCLYTVPAFANSSTINIDYLILVRYHGSKEL